MKHGNIDFINKDMPILGNEHQSFKSTLVDFTESMDEAQITKITIEQSREKLLKAC